MFGFRLATNRAPRVTDCCRRQVVANAGKKGFGSAKTASKGKKEKGGKKGKARKSKGKTGYRSPMKTSSNVAAAQAEAESAQPPSNPNETSVSPSGTQMPADIEPDFKPEPPAERVMSVGEEIAFEGRLAELKKNSQVLAKEKALKKSSDAPFAPPTGATKSSDMYDNPPSIMDTMSKTTPSEDKVDVFGGNQAAALGASVLLAVALLFGTIYTGSGGDEKSSRKEQMELSKVERQQLEAQQAVLASRLEENPEDAEALEGAAVTAVNLGDYEKGEGLLKQLVAIRSGDPEAWRLLAETRTALGRTASAAEAYKSAFLASPDDIVLLKGLAGSLVADGRQSDAVDEIKAVASNIQKLSSSSPTAEQTSEGDDTQRMTSIEVDLLLAKVYAQWKGHVGDAFAVYDQVIAANPEDFRGFLAKGVLLRNEGRKSDADRAFLQARFLAPKELRSIVDRVAAPES